MLNLDKPQAVDLSYIKNILRISMIKYDQESLETVNS